MLNGTGEKGIKKEKVADLLRGKGRLSFEQKKRRPICSPPKGD